MFSQRGDLSLVKKPRPTSVVRGVSPDGAAVGESFISLQFVSTSVIRSKKLKGQYEFIIHIPQGADVAYIEKLSKFKKQRELLINKNTMFTVVSRNECLVELEVKV